MIGQKMYALPLAALAVVVLVIVGLISGWPQ